MTSKSRLAVEREWIMWDQPAENRRVGALGGNEIKDAKWEREGRRRVGEQGGIGRETPSGSEKGEGERARGKWEGDGKRKVNMSGRDAEWERRRVGSGMVIGREKPGGDDQRRGANTSSGPRAWIDILGQWDQPIEKRQVGRW